MRGVIAAAVCAAVFVLIGLVVKNRWRERDADVADEANNGMAQYNRNNDAVVIQSVSRIGVDNPGANISDE